MKKKKKKKKTVGERKGGGQGREGKRSRAKMWRGKDANIMSNIRWGSRPDPQKKVGRQELSQGLLKAKNLQKMRRDEPKKPGGRPKRPGQEDLSWLTGQKDRTERFRIRWGGWGSKTTRRKEESKKSPRKWSRKPTTDSKLLVGTSKRKVKETAEKGDTGKRKGFTKCERAMLSLGS